RSRRALDQALVIEPAYLRWPQRVRDRNHRHRGARRLTAIAANGSVGGFLADALKDLVAHAVVVLGNLQDVGILLDRAALVGDRLGQSGLGFIGDLLPLALGSGLQALRVGLLQRNDLPDGGSSLVELFLRNTRVRLRRRGA